MAKPILIFFSLGAFEHAAPNAKTQTANSAFIFIDLLPQERCELEQIRTKKPLFGNKGAGRLDFVGFFLIFTFETKQNYDISIYQTSA